MPNTATIKPITNPVFWGQGGLHHRLQMNKQNSQNTEMSFNFLNLLKMIQLLLTIPLINFPKPGLFATHLRVTPCLDAYAFMTDFIN